MNEEEKIVVDEQANTPNPASPAYARMSRAERIAQDSLAPDFVAPKIKDTDAIFSEGVVNLTMPEIIGIVKDSKIEKGLGSQAAVAMENALIAYNSMDEQLNMISANITNLFTGNKIGEEWRDIAYDTMRKNKELQNINEESVGGVRNWLAKLAGGGITYGQMALEGFVTGGYLPVVKMAVEAFGEGTYNDLKAYEEEHGSLEGYEPKGIDLAVNAANAFVQGYIERKFGIGAPRFFVGWSKGLWKEGLSGALQEGAQAIADDLAEILKGNEDLSILADHAYDYLISASIGGVLQGALGAATHGQARSRADRIMALTRAQSQGRTTPNKEDFKFAKKINDAAERHLTSVLTTEFKAAFDASSGEGKLQANILKALNDATKKGDLDLGVADETERAQKLEGIATQETLNAMSQAFEEGKSVADMGISNIVYDNGDIWIEGLTPQVGERAVDYARVSAERQSGLADAQMKLDSLSQEVQQLKKDLADARVLNQQAQVEKLQARLNKQNALLERRKAQTERLKSQTAKIQQQIIKQLGEADGTNNVPPAKILLKSKAKKVLSEAEKKRINDLKKQSKAKADEVIAILKSKGQEATLKRRPREASEDASTYVLVGEKGKARKFRISYEVNAKDGQGAIYSYYSDMPAVEIAEDIMSAKPREKGQDMIHKGQQYYNDNKIDFNAIEDKGLQQSSLEGDKSDKYRGTYDERLKRIILNEKSDLTTIQHEFAHYWIQNNFKWARSGLASQEWLRRWRGVEEALGIEPQDRYLSKRASENFARAYERYIMEGKYSDDLKWAFDGFQKFYQQTYEDLENEYFDLSEELDPAIVDWFNRQRPTTEKALKEQAYKKVATVAMAQGADIATPVSDAGVVVSSMDSNGNIQTEMLVSDKGAQESKLAKFSDKKKKSRVEEGLKDTTKGAVQSREYNVLNRAQTIEQAQQWVANDKQGAWDALTNSNTNIIDRAALFQAFKQLAEDGDYAVGIELAKTKFPKELTEVGQAVSTLGERGEFDPLTIIENKQKSLGAPTDAEIATQTAEMGLDTELTKAQTKELEETTECVL